MKKPNFVLFALLVINFTSSVAHNEPASGAGSFDKSFGPRFTGTITTAFFSGNGVVLQAGGGILVPGQCVDDNSFCIASYTPAGIPNTTFSPSLDGIHKIIIEDESFTEEANAIALQKDGKIVAAGYANDDFAIARLLPDGRLDPSFGFDGTLSTSFGQGTTSKANAIAIQNDGKIVAAGYTKGDDDIHSLALARYLPDGHLDPEFGNAGLVALQIGTRGKVAQINGIVIDQRTITNGQTTLAILAAGVIEVASKPTFTAFRFLENGDLDLNLRGFFPPNYNGGPSSANAILLTDIVTTVSGNKVNRLILAGETGNAAQYLTSALSGYNIGANLSTGASYFNIDFLFGAQGSVFGDVPFGAVQGEAAYAVAQYPGVALGRGRIVIVGEATDLGGVERFMLKRFDADGVLDKSFGASLTNPGQVISDIKGEATGVAIQPNGKIVVVGNTKFLGKDAAVIARYNS